MVSIDSGNTVNRASGWRYRERSEQVNGKTKEASEASKNKASVASYNF